ncbi:MAG: alanyl-tRNA editing protein [Acidobacteriaceae bacterium]
MESSFITPAVAQRLYYDQDSALEFQAVVTGLRRGAPREGQGAPEEQRWLLAFDRTAFYPAGGGQPWDTGVLESAAASETPVQTLVERVEEDEAGEVWHTVREPLAVGSLVVGRVDALRRMDHAQQHTGQHLLSAIFLRELGLPTLSFHLGAESATIDLPAEKIAEEDLRKVEEAANHLIFEDRRIRQHWVEREEAEQMLQQGKLRKLPERSGRMRIVEMEGVEFNACGGTHVRSTGAIGGLLVRRLEKVRQGQRLEFCCGLRAVRTAGRDYVRLRELGALLSVGPAELASRAAGLIEEKKQWAKEIKLLQKQLREMEARLGVASQKGSARE